MEAVAGYIRGLREARKLTQAQAQPSAAVQLPMVVQATTQPEPTGEPNLPRPTFNDCAQDVNAGIAGNYPIKILDIDRIAETVTLQNRSPNAINLSGWVMCSVTGQQRHPIGGTILAGQTIVYPSNDPIWLDTGDDDGQLYTPDGRMVSFLRN